jgi:hypothetical protein
MPFRKLMWFMLSMAKESSQNALERFFPKVKDHRHSRRLEEAPLKGGIYSVFYVDSVFLYLVLPYCLIPIFTHFIFSSFVVLFSCHSFIGASSAACFGRLGGVSSILS